MDILIKGMKMPVDHGIFVVICPDGTIEQKVGNADNGYPIYNIVKDAKAVALPEHGRLISDRDVKALLHSGLSLDTDSDIDHVCGLIDGLPTIVEASNG